ncbi:DegT/DnrJ/EryC1/StrS family aminotransferase [Candidatus Symbiobacter mobilis]|nr:DegT/DnrJ/EryC1/StrS family aminotransferase [Candidatus Symbiobacter mobilis]
MSSFIPVNKPLLDGKEKQYLIECIESGWISSEGPFVEEFERRFAARVGRKHGVAVCNGTAAIDAAVEAIGIGPGDEVIVPTFTIISCIGQILRNGAWPIFIDSNPQTWNMDVGQIEKKITPRTKAILLVHVYGLPADVGPILEIAQKHGLKVIEDAAEMHGQTYCGKPCGSFGDLSIFSFYPNKHITTGEGGMVVTDDDELASTCRSLRNLCFQQQRRFVHDRLGWNLRMTNMQAALGLAQLERLDEFVQRKRAMGARYNELLHGLPGVQLPLQQTDYAQNIYWVYGIVLDASLGFDAHEAMHRLEEKRIGTRPFFYPLHLQPLLQEKYSSHKGAYPVAERMGEQGLYLPSGMALTMEQIDTVAKTVRDVLAQ